MKSLGRLLCRMGVHSWKYIGSDMFGHRAFKCGRPHCLRCKQYLYKVTVFWDREAAFKGDE